MGSLARTMARAAAKAKRHKRAVHTPPAIKESDVDVPGIFCDCYNTLYSYNYDRDELLVNYLNAQQAAGTNVYLITSNFSQVWEKLQNIGLNDRILRTLNEKKDLRNFILDVLIDDDPVGLTARIHHKPDDKKFRAHMQEFVAAHSASAPPPQP